MSEAYQSGYCAFCKTSGGMPRRLATRMCDAKTSGSSTCDAQCCAVHGREGKPGQHLCPEHQR